ILQLLLSVYKSYVCDPYPIFAHCDETLILYGHVSLFQDDWLQAVRALMVLAVIFACLGLGLFVYQLYQLEKGGRFIITGVFTLLASLLAMTAAAIYTSYGPDRSTIKLGNYGYSFIITWLAFALTFINSMVYLALRKRS
uniref:Epithelial membrane protein 2 n=1 Tax=Eptatretus burgeri TaxID=7764 RepID=A0A8C4QHL6_EPTBU